MAPPPKVYYHQSIITTALSTLWETARRCSLKMRLIPDEENMKYIAVLFAGNVAIQGLSCLLKKKLTQIRTSIGLQLYCTVFRFVTDTKDQITELTG